MKVVFEAASDLEERIIYKWRFWVVFLTIATRYEVLTS